MSGQIFRRRTDKFKTLVSGNWIDLFWAVGLLAAAVLIFSINLGGLPLRDWDEGIAGQVAREMWRGDLNWLYPTVGGTPYLNKPPLVHWLIALCFGVGGVNEWMARLAPAMLSASSVPLLYAIGRELFQQRLSAIFSALVCLTLLPVVRHGRLAMLDGAVLCFLLIMVLCVLRSRRNLRYALGAGISFGLICLTKGVLLGLLLGAIAFFFLLWDTPRLITSRYLWTGFAIGIFPVIAWYTAQWLHYGPQFLSANLLDQSLRRVWEPVGNHKGPPWYYLLEILESAWPWQLFWLLGLRQALENRNFAWGKLVLVWTGIYLAAISAMSTKLPWYVLPIYPAFALVVGHYLAEVWQVNDIRKEEGKEGEDEGQKSRGAEGKFPSSISPAPPLPRSPAPLLPRSPSPPLPFTLWPIFALLSAVAAAGCLYFSGLVKLGETFAPVERDLQLVLIAFGLTMAIVAMLLRQQDRQFILILFWGTYVSLLLLVMSNNWVWELAEDYPVKPVAEIVRQGTTAGQEVLTSHRYPRPSLDFYSDRRVIPAKVEELKREWQTSPQPYFLLHRSVLKKLALENVKVVKTAGNWVLVTRIVNS
ncbi:MULTISPECIES: ArnT family glycosyltransferase [Kamptonema]|uniref:ArnT family glycosyltransferase n=1 Tax=Kamptonema TaxID=1501433 RepID=UPI0001DAC38A|nr:MULTISPECIES: glycosyltransferase family 39 protein [Kamptonema]CBN54266.1 glycosyl transferase family protein [Kamptonema sp. PCC 6506]